MRRIESSWSNVVTIIVIIVVAVIEALQQALSQAPAVTAHVPTWVVSPTWNFVPLALLIVAGIVWLLGHVRPGQSGIHPVPVAAAPAPPSLPAWIAPDDRKLFVSRLKDLQTLTLKANKAPYKVAVFYGPTENATRLAEEFGALFSEAGWLEGSPAIRDPATVPLKSKGISLLSSMGGPTVMGGMHLSNLLNEIGIRHYRVMDGAFRKFNCCLLCIEE